LFFVFSETISASELTEESKLSILNKENQNIKANGYLYLTFLGGFKLIKHIFFFRIVESILPLVNGNSSIGEGQIEGATPKGRRLYY